MTLDEAFKSTLYCVVRNTSPSKFVPRFIAVLHDTSVDTAVASGACSIVADGLTYADAQARAIELSKVDK